MTTGYKIHIPSFRLDKSGGLVRDQKRLPVNVRLKQASSKKVRPVRRTAPR
jgi:hypothetical protein